LQSVEQLVFNQIVFLISFINKKEEQRKSLNAIHTTQTPNSTNETPTSPNGTASATPNEIRILME